MIRMDKDLPIDSLLRDGLTGVYTRAAFEQRLQEETASAERFG